MTGTLERLAVALADRYRLERELGQGGMATVYLAEDLKHKRKVAIKVLKPDLAAVLGADRFIHEITTTAALQHPHILPLFDSGSADGFLFYVMPFVEGETLRAKLDRERQLGIEDSVRIAREVADALDYAHRHGVIHRDIKPENILLHDGRATVADFGIALAVSAAAGGRMTETGLSLGTPHYMSPEQATAERELSGRSDIYSLGCVLYEMLTGNPPHTGATAQQIIMKIVTEEAAPVTTLRRAVPPHVAEAVAQAVEKLPADRFGTAKEFADALAGQGSALAPRRTRAMASAPASRRTTRATLPVLTGLVLLAALAAWGWLRPAATPASLPPSRLSIPMPAIGGTATALQRQLAISPDGSTLLFTVSDPGGDNVTMRMALHDTTATRVEGVTPRVADFVFSPDGREFLASLGLSGIYRYPVMGGAGRALPAGVAVGYGIVWGPDGTIWISNASDLERGIARIAPDGSVSYPYGAASNGYYLLQLLPDGRTALGVYQPLSSGAGPVILFDLESGATTELINRSVLEARYTAGFLVLALGGGTLEAVPFDPARKRVLGEAVQFAAGVSTPGNSLAQFAVSANGTVAYIPEEPRTLLLVDRSGSSRPATAERRSFHAPMFSPDGLRIAFDFTSAEGRDVWTLDLADGRMSRATFDRDGHDATWTPDGEWLTYLSSRTGAQGVHLARPGRAETAETLLLNPVVSWSGRWLADRGGLVTMGNGLRPESRGDIAIIGEGGRGAVEAVVATRFEEQHPSVSADGRWLAYTSDQSGRDEVYLRPLRGEGDQIQVSLEGGTEPVWSRRGMELFYRGGAGGGTDMVAAVIATTPRLMVTGRQNLFSVRAMGTATPHANYDVSPDGRTFAMVGFNPASRIIVIQNLPALVERLRGGR